MTFPIAMQSGNSYNQAPVRYESDLAAELTNDVASIAGKWMNSLKIKPDKRIPSFAAPLSAAEKLAQAANAGTPIARLQELSVDVDSAVRTEVIFNQATPAALLFLLAADSDRFVASQAKARLAA
ncbi:MAG: hypothetical protein K2W95_35400 [Candidatus Obscuribacterales bacterium]|nr:hypothetical protein [Candidatus Obscuribacterales bacterium]